MVIPLNRAANNPKVAAATPPTKVDTVKILNTANKAVTLNQVVTVNNKPDMANNKDTVKAKLPNMVNKINMAKANRKVTDSNLNTDSLAMMPPVALTLINNKVNMAKINTANLNTANREIHKIVA